ncbi:helix-turn-helix domain-containing protein [Ornithinimicrobium sp. F0845]|uniref:helix-turn-helix domain-containing protein n=1 Tax=Ornithinimicrobium sp. F0845 TaxID=2926412 RepID=UPI001FF5F712|nr:helix-turn-helix transcriptional regulator [Ornithinimicrobium sp. F0845]MCK0112805.1 helix-turn-helix domain-containing protein [Ornithinimicrobium sp. F0845]
MTIASRNVVVPPGTPVAAWPYEALVSVIERGLVADWAVLTREIRVDPWGPVARQVEEYLSYERPAGVGALLERVIDSARTAAAASERAEVAREVDDLIARSGLTTAVFAERIGTSASRLSTYRTGRVTPSAALLVRMRRVADQVGSSRLT